MNTLDLRSLKVTRSFPLFGKKSETLTDVVARVVADVGAIGFLEEKKDSTGKPYTKAYLNGNSALVYSEHAHEDENYDTYYVVLAGTLEDNKGLVSND